MLQFQCTACHWPVDPELVWKEERAKEAGKRSLLTGAAFGLMVLGFGLAALWIFGEGGPEEQQAPVWAKNPREALVHLLQTSKEAPPQVTDPYTIEWYWNPPDPTDPSGESPAPQVDKE